MRNLIIATKMICLIKMRQKYNIKRDRNQQKIKVQQSEEVDDKLKRGKHFIPKIEYIKFMKVKKNMITLVVIMLPLLNKQKCGQVFNM